MNKGIYLFFPQVCLSHDTAGHPESPQRLLRVMQELEHHQLLPRLTQREASPLDRELLYRMHHPQYVRQLEDLCRNAKTGTRIDEDTVISQGTFGAALGAAGTASGLVDSLLQERCESAFALVRPPGHHAMAEHAMGFCFFNNVALAALIAIECHGLKRVAILDWDVHHGNGTEHLFYHDPRVLCVSWHQENNWPGTGHWQDMGAGPGWGYNLNLPMPLHAGALSFLRSYREIVGPALQRFQPELILVAAGYDAHHADGLSDMGLTASAYGHLTECVMQSAAYAGAKVGFFLEGGYHTEALAHSVAATLLTLQAQAAQPYPENLGYPPKENLDALEPLLAQIRQQHLLLQEETR